jgi:hypothetical protein
VEIALPKCAGSTARYQVATIGPRLSEAQRRRSNLGNPYIKNRFKQIAYPLNITRKNTLGWGLAPEQAVGTVEPVLGAW